MLRIAVFVILLSINSVAPADNSTAEVEPPVETCEPTKPTKLETQESCEPTKQCPQPPEELCPENEVYDTCGTACPLTCDNFRDPPKYCTENCVIGCFCKEGLVRDANGKCIPPEQCPQVEPPEVLCQENEVYKTCGTACPLTCDNFRDPPKYCTKNCVIGCFCKEGLVRDAKGNCIPPQQCPQVIVPPLRCRRPNEAYLECGTMCPDYCSNYGILRPCPRGCRRGCFCKKGYVRDDDTGDCILPEECLIAPTPLPQICRADEEWNECGTACPITCENYKNPPIACQAICVPGCFCKEGLVRASDGRCIRPNECKDKPKCLKPNEEYTTCGTSCPRTCSNYWKDEPCDYKCNSGCFCKAGFVRDKRGNCILPTNCPNKEKCLKPNEIFTTCGTSCPETCRNRGLIIACNLLCNVGCFCKPGYVRDDNDDCILPQNCPKDIPNVCPGPNEEYLTSGSTCPDYCSNYGIMRPCPLGRVKGCFCKKGYIRDDNTGDCILPEECSIGTTPLPRICPAGEKWDECGTACPITCENYKNPPLFCQAVCVPGCFCTGGLVRSSDGRCIPSYECEDGLQCLRPNEEYTTCGTSCPKTCWNYWKDDMACDRKCNSGCFCKDGFVRDRRGNCILPTKCPNNEKCLKPNEYFTTCGTSCPETCRNRGLNLGCNFLCNVGCFCKHGYVRDDNNNCILPQNCPNPPPRKCRKPNEEYLKCGTACPDTCDNYWDKNRPCTLQCVEGCFCKQGFVRNAAGNCIYPKNCPGQSKCGPREIYKSCGTACPDTCDNYMIQPRPCTKNCVAGCFCRKGFVRNSCNRCVRPRDCCIKRP